MNCADKNLILGLPIYLIGMILWLRYLERLYFGYWNKSNRVFVTPVLDKGSDHTGTIFTMTVILILWNVALLPVIFGS